MWDRRHEDPLAPKQRWYCDTCTARYKTKFGVLCELVHGKSQIAAYALADIPPFDFKDVKTMTIQQRFGHIKTPQELYATIPKATPLDKGLFLAPTKIDGVFRFDVTMFRSIAKFKWDLMYNLRRKKGASPKSTGVKGRGRSADEFKVLEC